MKVCFPVSKPKGLESEVFNHFGSAPVFIICDTEDGSVAEVGNADLGHAHGSCNPLKALGGTKVDSIVVGGIGAGALSKLQALGIKVYRASESTVSANLSQLAEGTLKPMSPFNVCSGHGHGHGHGSAIKGGCNHHH